MADRKRFEAIALPLLPAAYNLAYSVLRSREEAEDAVQDAFVSAMASFADLRGEDVKPWLLTIVRHASYRLAKRRKSFAHVVALGQSDEDAFEPADTAPLADETLIQDEVQTAFDRAFSSLPPAFRDIITLRDIEGLSYRDIAKVLDCPIGTVMSRLARARDTLRERLQGKEFQEGRQA